MPLAMVIFGAVILIAGFRGTYPQLGTLVKGDFSGGADTNFIFWFAAIIAIGMIGYVPKLGGVSKALLALVILAVLLSNRGFFSQFVSALSQSGDAQTAQVPSAPGALPIKIENSPTSNSGGVGKVSSLAGNAGQIASLAAAFA